MPRMCGIDFTRELRLWEKDTGLTHIPIFMCSGDSKPEFRIDAYTSGVDLVFVKPISQAVLKEAIHGILKP